MTKKFMDRLHIRGSTTPSAADMEQLGLVRAQKEKEAQEMRAARKRILGGSATARATSSMRRRLELAGHDASPTYHVPDLDQDRGSRAA